MLDFWTGEHNRMELLRIFYVRGREDTNFAIEFTLPPSIDLLLIEGNHVT